MNGAYNALAIIPARGGSKRLPRKNLLPLGDKPLVCHTLEAVAKSGCFARAILSSDDPEILRQADNYPGIDAIARPPELSGDFVTALSLVNALLSVPENCQFDFVCLLLPTAPFRTAEHIRQGFALLSDEWDGVISLTAFDFSPFLGVSLCEDQITPLQNPSPLLGGNTRTQDQQAAYKPNGGFYIQRTAAFLKNRNFWAGKVRGYIMSRQDSIDIDEQIDLDYANFLIAHRSNNG